MRALVIDNHTGRIPDIEKLLLANNFKEIKVLRVEDYRFGDETNSDMVILTGATGLAVPTHIDEYGEEFKLIRQGSKPILGICVGFQAIVVAFGGDLKYREVDGIKGVIEIDVVKDDSIFGDKKKFDGFESHKYYVTDLPTPLVKLAESKYNIEVVRHVSKPIYGFQFHPEVLDPKNDGAEIFKNFIDKVVRG